MDRVKLCFRFLDRSGEGSLCWCEFKALNDIWNEMLVGLEEFLFFMRLRATSIELCRTKGLLKEQRPPSQAGTGPHQGRGAVVGGETASTGENSRGGKPIFSEKLRKTMVQGGISESAANETAFQAMRRIRIAEEEKIAENERAEVAAIESFLTLARELEANGKALGEEKGNTGESYNTPGGGVCYHTFHDPCCHQVRCREGLSSCSFDV